MSWKLILQLSLFGLAMAIATVSVIPPDDEIFCWPVIFGACALVIARRAPGRPFLHGFLVGMMNWGWVTATHVVLFEAWLATHAKEIASLQAMPMPALPPIVGPIAGPILELMRRYDAPLPGASGIVIGLAAWIASKAVRRRTAAT